MENRTTTNTFLQYKDHTGEIILWSIDRLINDGPPLVSDGAENEGDDMELVSDELFDCNGDPV